MPAIAQRRRDFPDLMINMIIGKQTLILTSKTSWLNPKIEIRPSTIGGRGMFALGKIEVDEEVLVFGGDYLDRQQADEEKAKGKLIIQWDKNLFTAE